MADSDPLVACSVHGTRNERVGVCPDRVGINFFIGMWEQVWGSPWRLQVPYVIPVPGVPRHILLIYFSFEVCLALIGKFGATGTNKIIIHTRKTIQNTPFQQHTIFSNTEMLWGGFLFLFLYNFFLQYVFFSIEKFVILRVNILSLINASTEMWYPKIWIRCWNWWLLNGHLLYGSTPNPLIHKYGDIK